MKNKVKFIINILILSSFFYGCRKAYPNPEEMKSYTVFIQTGDLKNVEKYYKKFGKGFLNTYGPGYYSINPLECALFYKQYDIADFLIAKGADVNAISPFTKEPIIITGIHNNDIEFVKYLIEKKAKLTCISHPLITTAAFENNIEIVKLILNYTKQVDEKDADGYSPLYIAAGNGYFELVKFLVEKGADVNLVNNDNSTPLSVAVMNGHVKVAEYLIEQGADISIKDNEGLDALWFANELNLNVKGLNH